ncbi:MAG TPA: alkaline phosphatase D family protein [Vicinamibacteria bacterium]
MSRRRFLREAAAFATAPALLRAEAARPSVAWGAQVGDLVLDPPAGEPGAAAVVWCRTDRPARLHVSWSTTESFRDARRLSGPAALEDSDFTAQLDLRGLPPGQTVFYRATFQDLRDLDRFSEPVLGRFQTPSREPRDVVLAWSADTCGQGYGINPEWGGLRMYETIRRSRPDVFLHCGDTIYADNPLVPELKLEDGSVFRNQVGEGKDHVAETLADFRGNWRYNLTDLNVRRLNAEVPLVLQWDDHEVRNNWYPTQTLTDPRYAEKSVALLAARAKRGFFDYSPLRRDPLDAERIDRALPFGPLVEVFVLDLRSYRGPNSPNRQTESGPLAAILGEGQLRRTAARIAASPAVWKVVACDMPLGLVVPDGALDLEAVAQGDPGPPLGRELEIASLLKALKARRVRNVVFVTGDVHYAAAHHYHPERARFHDFVPFWEFVAGPMHAGTFGPATLDPTFGPELRFLGIPPGMKPNRPPTDGLQFFGLLHIDAKSRVLTAELRNLAGDKLYSVEVPPESAT